MAANGAGFDFLAFRAQQSKQNEHILAETGHAETAIAARELAKKTTKAPSSAKPKAPREKKTTAPRKRKADAIADGAADEGALRRSSRRSQPMRAVNSQTEQERADIERRNREEAERQKAEEQRAKHAPRPVEANEGGTRDALGQGPLDEEFRRLALYDPAAHTEEEDEWEMGTRPPLGTVDQNEFANDLELRAIVKVIPERIYSMVVHPDPTRDLVFAGDKAGYISLWDCTDAGQPMPATEPKAVKSPVVGDDGEEGEDETEAEVEMNHGKWWNWKAHRTNSVSWLKFRPGQPGSLYSSAYDGTLRVTHFETGISEEVINGEHWAEDTLIHSFDFDPTGNQLWASDNDGGLIWRDLRQPMTKAKRWEIDRYKVGCISINQANPDLAATAHLKRYMALWDLTKLRGMSEDAKPDDIVMEAQIVSCEHEKACSSAYFDPTGTRLASTSYDDSIRVWDIDASNLRSLKKAYSTAPFSPVKRIPHNCQVGRYVTVLRAHWSTVPSLPPHLHIGSMDRSVDLYSPDGNSIARMYDADWITAVPAVTACHPTRPDRYYGGSASGKISFWSKPLETTEEAEE
ncbi:hypothetical protein JCM10908_001175 [Rhodotorula pacifica]|uniref:Cmr1p n=1 Tax=Rhodotorula pacifica TaxID=1495444 RepID=UPI0031756BF7